MVISSTGSVVSLRPEEIEARFVTAFMGTGSKREKIPAQHIKAFLWQGSAISQQKPGFESGNGSL